MTHGFVKVALSQSVNGGFTLLSQSVGWDIDGELLEGVGISTVECGFPPGIWSCWFIYISMSGLEEGEGLGGGPGGGPAGTTVGSVVAALKRAALKASTAVLPRPNSQ